MLNGSLCFFSAVSCRVDELDFFFEKKRNSSVVALFFFPLLHQTKLLMKLWWYSAANIIYALGSLGYLAINMINLIDQNTIQSLVTYIILVILAIVFVIDALLYTADWFEQRLTKNRRELIGCILNIIGSILYLIGATVFKNNQTSTNDFSNLSNIPAFVFNIVGMLAFLGESILTFFTPRVSKNPSKCSVEFFANLFNLLGNLIYLIANIIQPIISLIANLTTDFLNQINNFIFIIILPIEIFGDVIYIIDAILYIIVWIKANEQMRKVGAMWIERGNTKIKKIIKKKKSNVTTSEPLPEATVENRQLESNNPPVQTISEQISEPIIEDVEHLPDVETLT